MNGCTCGEFEGTTVWYTDCPVHGDNPDPTPEGVDLDPVVMCYRYHPDHPAHQTEAGREWRSMTVSMGDSAVSDGVQYDLVHTYAGTGDNPMFKAGTFQVVTFPLPR